MPRFFFDFHDGRSVVPDCEGRDLPNSATARLEAIEDAKELISTTIFRADNASLGEIKVRCEASRLSEFSVAFSDVIDGLRS